MAATETTEAPRTRTRIHTMEWDPDNETLTKHWTITKEKTVVNARDFPEPVQAFIYVYGLRQILQDCHSGVEGETPEIKTMAAKEMTEQKIRDLLDGKTESRGGAGFIMLAKAVANWLMREKGMSEADAMKTIEPLEVLPDDDEETQKEKEKKQRKLRSLGAVKVELDKLRGVDPASVLGV